jgi:predicted nucleic acid-binding protein
VVRDFLAARFPDPLLRLTEHGYREFLLHLADLGVTGGAAYDALVAATAASNAAELVTCDRRAVPVYDRYGVRTRVL